MFVVSKFAGEDEDTLLQYFQICRLVDFEKPRTKGSFLVITLRQRIRQRIINVPLLSIIIENQNQKHPTDVDKCCYRCI